MVEQSDQMMFKLQELMQQTGYPIAQENGQRKFGPPPKWVGPPPPRGCEIFIGKLPREIFEDELVPLFSRAGKIYELRLMMDFSGSNRGYAFVIYATKVEAAAAVKLLNNYEIRPRRCIGVCKSVDNCRLFLGNIPKTKSKGDILAELSKQVSGIVDVTLYKNCFEPKLNRGFAFVEFTSHRAAATARRSLVPGCFKLWDQEIVVDWAEPEPDINDEQMSKVKVLYVRNFGIRTTPDTIQTVFENAINNKIERVKKMYDYAFIHFHERAHAEMAFAKLQNAKFDGNNIEICWAKPVNRDLYRLQKLKRGNAKFNNSFDLNKTILLYKQQLEEKQYANRPSDEGIGSTYFGESPCYSPYDFKPLNYAYNVPETYTMAPAKLESMCKRYMWGLPIYNYQKVNDASGELWMCSVQLPQVGLPVLSAPQAIGPLTTRPCLSAQQAHVEAAEIALHTLTMQRVDRIQEPIPAPPLYTPIQNYTRVPPTQSCLGLPYNYPMYPSTSAMMPVQSVWRTI